MRLLGELRAHEGAAELREAVELLSATPAALEAARARVALGRSPHVADPEAVALLQTALTAARDCGARSVARDAVEGLAQRGHQPEDAVDAPPRLTSRQQRVLDLSAAGLGVNEIAQRLFLPPGTVRAALATTESGPS